jgi:hypothetical protein
MAMVFKDESIEVGDSIAQISRVFDLHKKEINTDAALKARDTIQWQCFVAVIH